MIPEMIVPTPAISDLDDDGRLEVVYLVSWRGNGEGLMLPPKFTVFAETLEERVRETAGEEGVWWLAGLLPARQQPWTHYMGARGDSVYSRGPH